MLVLFSVSKYVFSFRVNIQILVASLSIASIYATCSTYLVLRNVNTALIPQTPKLSICNFLRLLLIPVTYMQMSSSNPCSSDVLSLFPFFHRPLCNKMDGQDSELNDNKYKYLGYITV